MSPRKFDPMPRPADIRAKLVEGEVVFQPFYKEEDGFGIVKIKVAAPNGQTQEAVIMGQTGRMEKHGQPGDFAIGDTIRAEGFWDYDFTRGWQFQVSEIDHSVSEHRDLVADWAKRRRVKLDELTTSHVAARWGDGAPEILDANPYALCQAGLGFREADQLVRHRLGRAKAASVDSRRVGAALQQAVIDHEEEGNTMLPRAVANAKLAGLLGVDETAAATALAEVKDTQVVGADEQGYFLYATREIEQRLADMLAELSAQPPKPIDERAILQAAAAGGFKASDEQQQAILSMHRDPMPVLTGGPGTGKTSCLQAALDSLDAMGITYRLMAPTGKAAKRATEATGREATTIHSALGFAYIVGTAAAEPISEELWIMDEVSMLDQEVADAVLRARAEGQRIAFVGDVDQLPSVGKGSVFYDIIASDCGQLTRLTKTFRQGAGSLLLTNAQRVRDGKEPYWSAEQAEAVEGPVLEDFAYMSTRGAADTAARVFAYAQQHPDSLVISPQRSGPCGVYELNRMFQEQLNPGAEVLFEAEDGEYQVSLGDKVLVTRNQKKLGIVNGDIGHIVRADDERVVVRVDGRAVEIPRPKAEKILELGYVLTIHKSQGSQAHQVICPLSGGGNRMLSRNLIYTAWTRGQASCVVIGPKGAIKKALGVNGTERDTGLAHMLEERLAHDLGSKPQLGSLDSAGALEASETQRPQLDISA
jgi:exodeoxyribonuclease V alpha subunit